jgi:hypothetical protein
MKLSKAIWGLAACLMVTSLAHADGSTTMQFGTVNGANDGVYYVSPYTGTMNYGTSSAQSVTLFCVDINNEVQFGQTWSANITSLASNNYSNTRYGNGSVNPNLGAINPQTLYQEAAWLVTQFASNPGDYVSLQYALWDLMTPTAEPTGYSDADGITVGNWLASATANYSTINPTDFAVITNVGPLAYSGQVQEFVVRTPEPATVLLLLLGMALMFLLYPMRRQLEG